MSESDRWYSLAYLPAGRLRVRVRWGPYVVLAACDIDRKGRRHWHEMVGRELRPLRAEFEAWQPVDPVRWVWPGGSEPPALSVQVAPRLGVINGMAFDAVAAAEEMEADREAARAAGAGEHRESGQWWRDVARVAYEPAGEVSREMGEARIMRWLIAERSIRLDLKRYRTNAAVLAALKLTLADVISEDPGVDWVPPLALQPEDWRDFDQVMGWFTEVMPNKRELLVMRGRMLAPPATWAEMGDYLGVSYQRAREIYDTAIDKLIAASNRAPTRAKARLADLQERNRAARRTA